VQVEDRAARLATFAEKSFPDDISWNSDCLNELPC